MLHLPLRSKRKQPQNKRANCAKMCHRNSRPLFSQTEAADLQPYVFRGKKQKTKILLHIKQQMCLRGSERRKKKSGNNKSEVASGTDAACGDALIGHRRYYSKKLHRLSFERKPSTLPSFFLSSKLAFLNDLLRLAAAEEPCRCLFR